jgi:hypothetical protein
MTYGTYQLPAGIWQTVASFDDATEAEETMEFHAQGRPWLTADSPEALAELTAEHGDDDVHDKRG